MASNPERGEDRVRSKMVGWYDPRQLALTGLQTMLSALFAERADYRLIEALQAPPPPHDYRGKEEIWIDYVSDLGDGFNSTYSVARILADESLPAGKDDELPRGSVLVMGGDEVYPTPSHAAYQERLVRPYAAALGEGDTTDLLELYAVPGNHDWYDGLGSFMNLFCHGTASAPGRRRRSGAISRSSSPMASGSSAWTSSSSRTSTTRRSTISSALTSRREIG